MFYWLANDKCYPHWSGSFYHHSGIKLTYLSFQLVTPSRRRLKKQSRQAFPLSDVRITWLEDCSHTAGAEFSYVHTKNKEGHSWTLLKC